MPLIPDVQPPTLPEIATAMWKLCRARGWRAGWTRPAVFLEEESDGLLRSTWPFDYFPRDWLGRLVTDMPAKEVRDGEGS